MKDKRLDHMREEYEQIGIPGELRERVETAILQAKRELGMEEEIPRTKIQKADAKREEDAQKTVAGTQKTWTMEIDGAEEEDWSMSQGSRGKQKGNRRGRTRRSPLSWAGGIAGTAAAAMLVITVLANTSPSVAYAMESIPVLGSIVKVVTFRNYERKENTMEANIKVPELQVEDSTGQVQEESTEELNRRIQEYTDEIIARYEADVEAAGGEGHESVELDYRIVTDNEKLFSIRFDELIVMASGTQLVKIYHVDKTTGEVINLDGLFQADADYVTAISENIKEQMKEQMAEDENVSYWVDSDMPEWNFKEIRKDAVFYVNEAGHLVIVFDEYEVAPGFMGSQEFEIPTEVIAGMVKEGYLLP